MQYQHIKILLPFQGVFLRVSFEFVLNRLNNWRCCTHQARIVRLLIECLSMTEADAHRYIEKQAMDLRISKRAAAENVIRTYGR